MASPSNPPTNVSKVVSTTNFAHDVSPTCAKRLDERLILLTRLLARTREQVYKVDCTD